MGFFDKVKDVLISSDESRAKSARERAGESAEKTGESGRKATHERLPAEVEAAQSGADPQEQAHAVLQRPEVPQGEESTEGGTQARRHRTHTVQRGDTLASIAGRYGVDEQEVARLNNLDNPDLIYPGQVVRVPHS